MGKPLSADETNVLDLWVLSVQGGSYACARGHINAIYQHAEWVAIDGRSLIAITCPTCHMVELVDTGLLPPE